MSEMDCSENPKNPINPINGRLADSAAIISKNSDIQLAAMYNLMTPDSDGIRAVTFVEDHIARFRAMYEFCDKINNIHGIPYWLWVLLSEYEGGNYSSLYARWVQEIDSASAQCDKLLRIVTYIRRFDAAASKLNLAWDNITQEHSLWHVKHPMVDKYDIKDIILAPPQATKNGCKTDTITVSDVIPDCTDGGKKAVPILANVLFRKTGSKESLSLSRNLKACTDLFADIMSCLRTRDEKEDRASLITTLSIKLYYALKIVSQPLTRISSAATCFPLTTIPNKNYETLLHVIGILTQATVLDQEYQIQKQYSSLISSDIRDSKNKQLFLAQIKNYCRSVLISSGRIEAKPKTTKVSKPNTTKTVITTDESPEGPPKEPESSSLSSEGKALTGTNITELKPKKKKKKDKKRKRAPPQVISVGLNPEYQAHAFDMDMLEVETVRFGGTSTSDSDAGAKKRQKKKIVDSSSDSEPEPEPELEMTQISN